MFTKDRSFYQTLGKLMLALMLQQAVVLSVNLADNIMLGNYSEISLSGVAAVNQIQFMLQQLVFAVSNGMIVLSSQYWGQQKIDPIRRLLTTAFWGGSLVSLILFVLVSLLPYQILGLFTTDPAIIEEGVRYLAIVKWSYLFFAVATILLGGMRTVEKVNISLYVSFMALIINCIINYTLIFGKFGMPRMGVRGAAIGTLIARIAECMVVLIYVFVADSRLQARPRHLLSIDMQLTRDCIKVTLPILLSAFLWAVNTALQTVILGHMSSAAMAAHSISSTIFLFLKVAPVGAASASAIIVGKAVGVGDRKKVREYVRTLQLIFVLIGASLGLLLLVIRAPFLTMYNLSDETLGYANAFIIIESTVLLFMSYQMSMNTGVISGGGDPKFITYVDIVGIWCIAVPLSLLAAFYWKLSPVIVVFFLNIDQYLKCIPAFIYGNSYKWMKKLTR